MSWRRITRSQSISSYAIDIICPEYPWPQTVRISSCTDGGMCIQQFAGKILVFKTTRDNKYITSESPIHGVQQCRFLRIKSSWAIFFNFTQHVLRIEHTCLVLFSLPHWGRVTQIWVSKLAIIGLDNGLSPGRRQAIIWTNAGILLIGPLGKNFSEILIEIHTLSFKEIHPKMSSGNGGHFVSASMC